jgi:type I restriction enzyme S subunit
MNGELPQGWSTRSVGEIFRSFSGGTPARGTPAYWNGRIPWLSSGDIKTERIQSASETITRVGLDNSSASLCRPGSVVVVVRSGILKHTLPVAVLDHEAAINQDIKCFDSGSDELNSWLALALRASAKEILTLNREGTTVQSVKYETLKEFPLPVPPLAEQKRIVTALEGLLPRVETSRQRLEKIFLFLKRFQQSVLAAACSGRLTEDWRKSHPTFVHPAEAVNAVREDRKKKASTIPQKDKLNDIYDRIEENDSRELPESWRYFALNKLCWSFDYGTSAKSQRSGKVPVLRMGNIQNGRLDWEDLVYTSNPAEIKTYMLKPNTVLFNRTNSPELVGKTAIYRGEQPAIFAGYLIRINPVPVLDPEYLNLCLNTNYAKAFCLQVKTDGVSQSNINAQKLGMFEVPFCPLDEQQEIVRRVRALAEIGARIAARCGEARKQVDKMPQSILAKAFRGELVPQDPNDEPASVLLAGLTEAKITPSEGAARENGPSSTSSAQEKAASSKTVKRTRATTIKRSKPRPFSGRR